MQTRNENKKILFSTTDSMSTTSQHAPTVLLNGENTVFESNTLQIFFSTLLQQSRNDRLPTHTRRLTKIQIAIANKVAANE
jgi:hypothetical protein